MKSTPWIAPRVLALWIIMGVWWKDRKITYRLVQIAFEIQQQTTRKYMDHIGFIFPHPTIALLFKLSQEFGDKGNKMNSPLTFFAISSTVLIC